jgi:eukaryotic-like serine/threonine-protein kinase
MAPEQAARQPVTSAGDWYAVGVMLFEALTGRLPFEGPPLDVLHDKQLLEPPAPHDLVPEIPDDLDTLTMELLRRSPAERPVGAEILQRLARPAGPAPRQETPVSRPPLIGARPTFIGRRPHLEALQDAFTDMRSGHPVVLHVQGPSGVGKSTLIRAFLGSIAERADAVILTGQCYEQEAVPYKALDSLVDALSRYLVRLPAVEAADLLPGDVLTLARLFPVLRRVEAVAQAPRRPLDLADPHEVRRRALAALRELLGRLGDRKPLVLFIDDLQWGDADSAVLLADLLQPPDAPLLLVIVSHRGEPGLAALGQGLDCRQLAVEKQK